MNKLKFGQKKLCNCCNLILSSFESSLLALRMVIGQGCGGVVKIQHLHYIPIPPTDVSSTILQEAIEMQIAILCFELQIQPSFYVAYLSYFQPLCMAMYKSEIIFPLLILFQFLSFISFSLYSFAKFCVRIITAFLHIVTRFLKVKRRSFRPSVKKQTL